MLHAKSSRRSFIGRSVAIAASGCAAVHGHLWGSSAKASGLPAGIQLYAVKGALAADLPGTLRQLRSLGYREVEAAGYGTHTCEAYAAAIREAGLTCPSAHLPLGNEADRGPLYAQAHTLGAEYATSSTLFPPRQPGRGPGLGLDGFKALAALMNTVGESARRAGLRYAYHNHSHEFERMPDGRYGYDVLLAETDPSLVCFEIDCGWMSVAGASPAEYLRKTPGRFRMLHIKDFKKTDSPYILSGSGPRPAGTELGRGFVQYGPIFAAAHQAGIRHVFAEQEAPFAVSEMDSAKVDLAFLQTML